jgi:mannose-6-phosphate isomerase-like protein (cupin superfamily)
VDKKYEAVARRGYAGVLTKISLDGDGLANITDICEGTNVSDLAYYFARKRNVNDFHGLGAFLIMNEYFLTGHSAMEMTRPSGKAVQAAMSNSSGERRTEPVSIVITSSPQAGTASAPARNAESPAPDTVKYFSAAEVRASFEKGSPLITKDGRSYSVSTGRRDKPGQSELHEKDTDVFYIVEGSATFVTGGKMLDAKTTGPGEVRGSGIEGGRTQTLSKDDVVVIPAGVPHWFKDVQGTFLYFVVKTQ